MDSETAEYFKGELIKLELVRILEGGSPNAESTYFYFHITNWPTIGCSLVGKQFTREELSGMFLNVARLIMEGPPCANEKKNRSRK